MELGTVVVVLLAQLEKVFTRLGNVVRMELHIDGAHIGDKAYIGFFLDPGISNHIFLQNGRFVDQSSILGGGRERGSNFTGGKVSGIELVGFLFFSDFDLRSFVSTIKLS